MPKQFLDYNGLQTYHEGITGYIDDKVVELTQAQYDQLDPPDPDVTYYITDAEGGGGELAAIVADLVDRVEALENRT